MFDPTFSIRLAIAVFRATQRRFQVVGSTSWPIAEGRIFGGGAVEPDDLQSWMAVVTYNYSAFGEYYSGTHRRGFRRKKKAEAFLERFPGNTPIPVRYKPNRPEISILLLTDLGLLLAGL